MKVNTRKVVIRETLWDKRPWNVTDLKYGKTRYYKTAFNALAGIKRQDAIDAKQDISTVTTIEWQPITNVGIHVVQALQLAEQG